MFFKSARAEKSDRKARRCGPFQNKCEERGRREQGFRLDLTGVAPKASTDTLPEVRKRGLKNETRDNTANTTTGAGNNLS